MSLHSSEQGWAVSSNLTFGELREFITSRFAWGVTVPGTAIGMAAIYNGSDVLPQGAPAFDHLGFMIMSGTFAAFLATLMLSIATIVVVVSDSCRLIVSNDWQRFWYLIGFAMPSRIRGDLYDPAIEDLKQDLIESRRFRTKWSRRWLNFCFSVRTVVLFLDCYRCWISVGVGKTLEQILLKAIPLRWRDWWMG